MDSLIKVIPGEKYTPYTLALKLGAKVILESSSYKKGRERYSVLLVEEAFRLSQRGQSIFFHKGSQTMKIHSTGKDILDVLMYFARQHPDPGQDFPFPAGGIGFLSFEFSRFCDTIAFVQKPDALGLPDALFLFAHVLAIFDHYTDKIFLIGLNYKESHVDLEAALDRVESRITDGDWAYLDTQDSHYPAREVDPGYDEKQVFKDGVAQIREEIIAGNLLQGVMSRRLRIRTDLPALEAYKRLRSSNPSPYMFYLDFGDFQYFGASPEVHVKVRDGVGEIRPIAGTRRRGKDEAEDLALEKELLADVKERAEHLMLVDLARNDLGRICEAGSVKVTDYYTIERYSHVMHIVSRVEGRLKPDKLGIDALRATFPAGTVSGAPKIRAIEILDRLEPEPRKFYAGVVGHLDPLGNLDTCIAIRSALKMGNTMILQAGAGVVYDSTPERELEETNEKLRALSRSIGLEV